MNSYEAKQEARRERLEARAERLRKESAASFKRVDQICDGIPFGQPILVGHHSEGRARRDQERIHQGMRRGVDLAKEADAVAYRAAAVGTGGISSDDPEAIEKLREKLARCEELQATAKRVNALVRKAVKLHGDDDAKIADYLIEQGISKTLAKTASEPVYGRRGMPGYVLSNNSSEMRRIKERIALLEKRATQQSTEEMIGDIELVCSVEDNRVRLIFPGRPQPDTIAELKGSGFRWSPSEKAWQRHLSNAAEYYARRIAERALAASAAAAAVGAEPSA